MVAYGIKIKMARTGLDLSQKDLAEKAQVSPTTVVNLEKSKEEPTAKVKQKLENVLNRLGAFITDHGVEVHGNWYQYSGEDWFLKLLDDIEETLAQYPAMHKILYIANADDTKSSSEVLEKYRSLRRQGVKMRQLVKEGNTQLYGSVEEYRYIPKQFFKNYVRLIFGHKAAIRDGDETCTVYTNPHVVEAFKNEFDMNWFSLPMPEKSESEVKFDEE